MGGQTDRAKAKLKGDLELDDVKIELLGEIDLQHFAITNEYSYMKGVHGKQMLMWKKVGTLKHILSNCGRALEPSILGCSIFSLF